MIDNQVLWCLNSNPKNWEFKKDTRKESILEWKPVKEVIKEEVEKPLEEIKEEKIVEEHKDFWYDKSVNIPPERDPLHFDVMYRDMIKWLIINRFDFSVLS